MTNASRTYNFVRNFFFSIINQSVMLVVNFLSRYVFIKVLGEEYLGINGLFSDLLTMISLADLGLGNVMVYSLYKPLYEKDNNKVCELMTFYKKLYTYISIGIFTIGMIMLPFIDNLIVDSRINNVHFYYILFLLNSVVSYLFVYNTTFINANQQSYIAVRYSMIINIIKSLLQSIFLLLTKNFALYLLIQIFSTLTNNLIINRKVKILYPFLNNKRDIDISEKKEIISGIKSVFLYKFSGILLNGTDNILITKLVGLTYVGYYSNYLMIIRAITGFINTIFRSLSAGIGNLVASDNTNRKFEVFQITQMISFWISGICVITLYFLINDFISLWIGKEFVLGNDILFAILVNFYLSIVLQPIWSYREATGLFKKIRYVMLITAFINLVLSIILGIEYGLFGILISSAISRLVTYCWYEPIILFRDYFNISPKKHFIDNILNILRISVCIVIINRILSNISDISWINLFIKLLITSLVSLIIYVIFYFDRKEFKMFLNSIKIRLKKK